jgi:membrane protease subunit (stomatin/prohibitin family)
MGMAQTMMNSMKSATGAVETAPAGAAPAPAAGTKFCIECGKPMPATGKFCPNCGTPQP